MHGTGDLFVPIFLQQTLKRAVATSGKRDLLVQRVRASPVIAGSVWPEADGVRRSGGSGCGETRSGGDDVLGDLSNAGLKFTSRSGLTIRERCACHPRRSLTTPNRPWRVDFARDVQPILRQQCYGCHGPNHSR